MPLAHARSPASLTSLRQGIFQATHDPDLAERIFGLAVASKSPPVGSVLPWLHDEAQSRRSSVLPVVVLPAVAHLAHDLCVLMAFIRANQAERAQELLGPANWHLVGKMGGWQALHDMPPHFRRRHLHRRLATLLTCQRTGRSLRAARPLVPARHVDAQRLLGVAQEVVPSLAGLDVYDLVARPLSAGSLAFLLDRLGQAAADWSGERVRTAWYRLAARCPTVADE